MNKPQRDPRSILPLNHSDFHIMLALADADRHGYGIMQEIAARSNDTVQLGPGTLYGAIKRLLLSGLIEESEERPLAELDDDRRRCYYRLTEFGRSAASVEAERLAELIQVAQAKKLLSNRRFAADGGIV